MLNVRLVYYNFPYTVLQSFMVTTRVRLSLFERILPFESGAHRKPNWASF